MSLLSRYIFQRHARLLLLIMSLGVGLYLLTELVEKVDIFIDNDAEFWIIVQYFGCRLPSIIAQILPAVFLLATVITLCLMGHNRELTALHAGGVSFTSIAVVLVFCGLFWGVLQFSCSQFIGVQGEHYADYLWQEQVRKRDTSQRRIANVWFMESGWTVSVGLLGADGSGTNFRAFHVQEGTNNVDVLVRAPSVKAETGGWVAKNAVRILPESYQSEELSRLTLPIYQDPEVFFATSTINVQQLPLWQLGGIIKQLSVAGSNVEGLRTVWHGKIAYAVSLMVMALLGAAIVSWNANIYIAVSASMAGTFIMYSLTMFGESLGQQGVLPPLVAAWGPDLLLVLLSAARLCFVSIRR